MPVPMMPQANSAKVNSPASGRSACGGLRRAVDVGDAVGVKRQRGGEHHAEGDDVREQHADRRVELDALQVLAHEGRRHRRAAVLRVAVSMRWRCSASCAACQKNR